MKSLKEMLKVYTVVVGVNDILSVFCFAKCKFMFNFKQPAYLMFSIKMCSLRILGCAFSFQCICLWNKACCGKAGLFI